MKSICSLTGIFAVIACVAALLASSATAPAQGAPEHQTRTLISSGTCETTATKFKTAGGLQSTTSTTFVNVLDMVINFTQGGTRANCVIVSFSAEAGAAAANGIMQIRAWLDGISACQPDGGVFVRSNATPTSYALRAIDLVCADVAPGTHSLRMQFLSATGGQVDIFQRAMLVHYVK